MPDAFDPYFKWLGIPKADQPPHCYRLLGIELFESDLDVISNAVDARMAQLKSFQGGQHAADSQKLLNEIAAAKIWLLNPQKKLAYDAKLRDAVERRKQAATSQVRVAEPLPDEQPGVANTSSSPFADFDFQSTRSATASSVTARSSASRVADKKQKLPIWVIPSAGGALALIAGLGIYVATLSSNNRQTTAAHNSSEQPTEGSSAAPASTAAAVPTSLKNPAAKPSDSSSPAKASDRIAADAHPLTLPQVKRPGESDDGNSTKLAPKEVKPEPAAVAKADFKPEGAAAAETAKATAEAPVADKRNKRLPVPHKAALHEMDTEIHSLFKDEFAAAKTIDGHGELAKKLLQHADGSNDDPKAQFVLWKLGAEEAIAAGDCSLAMDTVDKMEQQYDFDGRKFKALLLDGALQKGSIMATAPLVFEIAQKLATACAETDDYDLALRFAKMATTVAARMRDKDPKAAHDASLHRAEIEQMATKYTAVQKAIEALATDPADADANLTAGKWYCFIKGNWEKGLPFLAKSGHKDFADLAKQELAKPSGSKNCIALADGWWTLADKEHSSLKAAYQQHAAQWYGEALPGLSGLGKAQVEKRIASVKQDAAAESHAGATPSRGFGSRGAVVKGNVALLSNGATSTGPEYFPNKMLDPDRKEPTSFAMAPCEFVITLDRIYQLQVIRFKLQLNQGAAYQVLVSRDGKKYDVVADHSNEMTSDWQEIPLSPSRPVKLVKLVCNQGSPRFCVDSFEAYCLPNAAEKASGKSGRGR